MSLAYLRSVSKTSAAGVVLCQGVARISKRSPAKLFELIYIGNAHRYTFSTPLLMDSGFLNVDLELTRLRKMFRRQVERL